MLYYFLFIFILMQNAAETNSAERIVEDSELVCNAEPAAHIQELNLTVSWYQCRNNCDCEQLLGSVKPTSRCFLSSLKGVSFKVRTAENSSILMVISDLQKEGAEFYKCVQNADQKIQKVCLHIKQVLGPVDPQLTTTTIETTSSAEFTSPTRLNISIAEVVLISIAVALWLGVITMMLFLFLYGRHFCLTARSSQASVRRPEMFQITQTHSETTAQSFSSHHLHQRNRPDSESQGEEDAYESLSGGTGDVYNNLDVASRQMELNDEIRRCFRRSEY